MERDLHLSGRSGPSAESWKGSAGAEAGSERSEKDKDDKDNKKDRKAKVLPFPLKEIDKSLISDGALSGKESSKESDKPKTSQPEQLAEVFDLDAFRRNKAERAATEKSEASENGKADSEPKVEVEPKAEAAAGPKPESDDKDEAVAQAEVPKFETASETTDNTVEYPMAAGAEPPMSPPPVGWKAESRPANRHLSSLEMNSESNDNGAESAGTPDGEAAPDGGASPESAQPEAPLDAGEAWMARVRTRIENAPQTGGGDGEGPEGPASAPQRFRMWFEQNADRRNRDERTVGDVRQAMAAGLVVGWLFGRHRKKRAVRRAIEATKRRFSKPDKKWTFWKPDHDKYNPERFNKPSAPSQSGERSAPSPGWLQPETRSAAANRLTAERMESTPLADALAVPAAVTAARLRAERKNLANNAESVMSETQLVEIAKTIKVDGIPLHKIYESRQIDTEGLRAVVAAYLRGESASKQLAREITEKQKSFERDPYSRRGNGEKQPNVLRKAAGQVGGALAATGAGLAQGSQYVAGKVGQGVTSAAATVSSASSSVRANAKAPASAVNRSSASEGGSGGSIIGIVAVVVIYALILVLWLTRPR